MNIIILGWGSLIWCPGGLRIKTRWHRASEYVTHASARVDTAVRQMMRARGWSDAALPSILFEPEPAKDAQ